jgi:hypothetical protein
MKENEPKELTNQSKLPNLEEGSIFMNEGNNGGIDDELVAPIESVAEDSGSQESVGIGITPGGRRKLERLLTDKSVPLSVRRAIEETLGEAVGNAENVKIPPEEDVLERELTPEELRLAERIEGFADSFYEMEPRQLTPEAEAFLEQFEEGNEPENIEVTESVERMFVDNRIPKEVVDEFKDKGSLALVEFLWAQKARVMDDKEDRSAPPPTSSENTTTEEQGIPPAPVRIREQQENIVRAREANYEAMDGLADEESDREFEAFAARKFGIDDPETIAKLKAEFFTGRDRQGRPTGKNVRQMARDSRQEAMIRARELTLEAISHKEAYDAARARGAEGLNDLLLARQAILKDAERIDAEGTISREVRKKHNIDGHLKTLRNNNATQEQIDEAVDALSPHIIAYHKNLEEELPSMPKSLEDLARLIMAKDPEFRTGEALELLDYEGRVNTKNFLTWVRHKMREVHDFNSQNEVSFFTDEGMQIKTDYRAISFVEMAFTKSFFLERTIDEATGREVTKKNKDYEALRDQMFQEVFLFQLIRNGGISYDQHNRQGEDMLKIVDGIFKTNPITRAEFLEFILTMPSLSQRALGEGVETGREMQNALENNALMGDAVRLAVCAYESSYSYELMAKFLGKDSPMFRKAFRKFSAKNKDDPTTHGVTIESITPNPKQKAGTPTRDDWFDGDGRLRPEHKKLKLKKGKGSFEENYMFYINIFNIPSVDKAQVDEIRARMIDSIRLRTGVSWEEAQLAEAYAFGMIQIAGVAAQLDISGTSHNYWTRLLHTEDKRSRDIQPTRRAKYGRKRTIGQVKRLGVTLMEGAADVHGKSIKRIFHGGEGMDASPELNPLKTRHDYERFGSGESKGNIVFLDANGNRVDLNVRDYRLNEEGQIIFLSEMLDANGERQVAQTEGYSTQEPITRTVAESDRVRFDIDTQRQFFGNHLRCGVEVNEFIVGGVELLIPDLVTGYDGFGNPIIDHEKSDKLKEGIIKNIKYKDSTWGGINYAERIVVPIYAYNEARIRTGVEIQEVTILEDMFGPEVRKYIGAELKRRGIEESKSNDVPLIEGLGRFDLSKISGSDLRESCWIGEFDYLVAAEIDDHREFGSGYDRWGSSKIKRLEDAGKISGILPQAEVSFIREQTKTRARRVYTQDMTFAVSSGMLEGFWKVFQIAMKS